MMGGIEVVALRWSPSTAAVCVEERVLFVSVGQGEVLGVLGGAFVERCVRGGVQGGVEDVIG